jgi:hypothetical protein
MGRTTPANIIKASSVCAPAPQGRIGFEHRCNNIGGGKMNRSTSMLGAMAVMSMVLPVAALADNTA